MKRAKATKTQLRRERRGKRLRKLKAACLSLGLATAWGVEAQADTMVSIDLAPTVSLQDAVVVFGNNVSTATGFYLGDIPYGITTNIVKRFESGDWRYEFINEREYLVNGSSPNVGYALLAAYDDDGTPGVVVSCPDDGPVVAMQEWADIFWNITEAQALDGLSHGYADTRFGNYYSDIMNTDYGTQATLVSFSTAADVGTITVTVVPEPATWGLVAGAVGIAALARRRD